jgi:predicted secreted protein
MATSTLPDPKRPAWQYKLLATLVGVTLVTAGGIMIATQPTQAQTDLQLDGLNISDVNRSVDGDVSAVALSTDVDYSFDVPDSSRVVVELKAGPDRQHLETLAFRNIDNPNTEGSGSFEMGGDLTQHTRLSPQQFNPALAGTRTKSVVVVARIEVRRSGGGNVTSTASDRVDVTLHDGATLNASVGGTGNITVSATG